MIRHWMRWASMCGMMAAVMVLSASASSQAETSLSHSGTWEGTFGEDDSEPSGLCYDDGGEHVFSFAGRPYYGRPNSVHFLKYMEGKCEDYHDPAPPFED